MIDSFTTPYVEAYSSWSTCQRWHPGETHETQFIDAATSYSLWLILEGTVEVRAGDREWRVNPGHAFLFPLAVHRRITTPDGAEWLSIGLQGMLYGKIDLFRDVKPPLMWLPSEPDRATLETWMRQLTSRESSSASHDRLIRQGLARAIIGLSAGSLGISLELSESHRAMPGWLESVLREVQENPGVSIVALAGIAKYSQAQFRRVFAQWMGMSPHDYVQSFRMRLAMHLLASTDMPVASIADRLGFASAEHFSRLFSRTYGSPPNRSRKMMNSHLI